MPATTTATMAPKAEAAEESKFWTTRNYILAALGAVLAVTAITSVLSIALSPGHITFTVVHSSSSTNGTGEDSASQNLNLNLTITATNDSKRRAAVRYQGVFVDLKNSSSANGRDTIHAQLYAKPDPKEYLPEAAASIDAWVLVGSQDFAGDRASSGGFTVVITALVRFSVWKVPTRLYDIKVSCPHVLFPEQQGLPSSKQAVQQPVNCTG